jgi:prepilin-type N-terminal cleavage/methylation domain-containing protein
LLALSDHPPHSKAGASSTHSIRFASSQPPEKSSQQETIPSDADGLKICATHAAGGFSLIEVLCAILILGVAMAGLTRGITTALSSTKESELQTTAALIAAGLVESLRTEGGLLDGETEGSFGGGLALYRWKETVTASRIDGLHEVKVVVQNARSGQTIYELQTMLFEPTADTKPAKEKDKKAKKRGGSKG